MSEAFPIVADPRYRLLTASSNQSVFSVTFPFLDAAELAVTRIDLSGATTLLARPANYNVSGAGNPAGGTVTLKAGVPAGTKLLVVGNTSRGRSNDVTRGGKFSSAATDADFDRLILIAQELDRDIGRAAKAAFGDTPPLLEPGDANTLAVWDAAGNLVGGPDAAGIEALDAALGVDAGRALIYAASPSDAPYDAHSRPIRNLPDGTDPTDAATKGQLDGLVDSFGLDGIEARFEALEQGWRTGDLKISLSDDVQDGWLAVNAQTIGDASSGGTARANADCEALFTLIWGKYDNTLSTIQTSSGVPTTRGASAAADWAAHRRLPLLAVGGEFLRFLDGGRGVDADRVLGSSQEELLRAHSHTFTGTPLPTHQHSYVFTDDVDNGAGNNPNSSTASGSARSLFSSAVSAGTPQGSISSTGGAENRPRNIAFPLFVKL